MVMGKIEGVTYPEQGPSEIRVPLGTLEFARIDLYEVGDYFAEVLDSHSGDWEAFTRLDLSDDSALRDNLEHYLLLLDPVELVPETRGKRLGLQSSLGRS